jgi:hypothetical protein
MGPKLRKIYNVVGGIVSVVLGIWSLRRAVEPTSTFGPWTHQQFGYALVTFGRSCHRCSFGWTGSGCALIFRQAIQKEKSLSIRMI